MSSEVVRLLFSLLLTVTTTLTVNAQSQGTCAAGMIQLFNGVPCGSDQTCQRLSTGFFCFRGQCCSNTISIPSGYGSSCSSNNQCLFLNAQCVGNVCYCQSGYNFNGQQCQVGGIFRDDNTVDGFCPPSEININGVCYPLRSFFGSCEFSQQCSFPGGICDQNKCRCPTRLLFNGYQCIQDQALPGQGVCPTNQVMINNQCYQLVGLGERCIYDQQCQSGAVMDSGFQCRNGLCQRVQGVTPRPSLVTCVNPSAVPEMVGSVPKNCISQSCGIGKHCEYNPTILQYICCGPPTGTGQYGDIKMYPGYKNLPLQCFGVNSCTFVDYPYCVYSQSYRHNVCCSKNECI